MNNPFDFVKPPAKRPHLESDNVNETAESTITSINTGTDVEFGNAEEEIIVTHSCWEIPVDNTPDDNAILLEDSCFDDEESIDDIENPDSGRENTVSKPEREVLGPKDISRTVDQGPVQPLLNRFPQHKRGSCFRNFNPSFMRGTNGWNILWRKILCTAFNVGIFRLILRQLFL